MRRVIVLGGTEFIGRRLVEHLVARGDEVLVVHRGVHEPDDLVPVEHLHTSRAALHDHRDRLASYRADAVVDTYSSDGPACQAAIASLPANSRWVGLSSCDVYRAFGSVVSGEQSDAVPLDEASALRGPSQRFLDGPDGGENLESEAAYRTVGATILRLAAVYGEHDQQRRHEFVLRRIRASRTRMPIGVGSFLFSRVYVGDVAAAVDAAIERDVAGEVFNIAERATVGWRQWAAATAGAVSASLELIRVSDERLPADLRMTGSVAQHLLIDSAKARELLGWSDTPPDEALAVSACWHLAHPPLEPDDDFDADDRALAGP